jgi:hypothetical protein
MNWLAGVCRQALVAICFCCFCAALSDPILEEQLRRALPAADRNRDGLVRIRDEPLINPPHPNEKPHEDELYALFYKARFLHFAIDFCISSQQLLNRCKQHSQVESSQSFLSKRQSLQAAGNCLERFLQTLLSMERKHHLMALLIGSFCLASRI